MDVKDYLTATDTLDTMALMTDTTYTLRGIDPGLWRQVKMKAASEGKPIRTVILELLQRYVSEKGN